MGIERLHAARVDHFGVDAEAFQRLGGLQRFVQHPAERDDRVVGAAAHDVRDADRHFVRAFRYLALQAERHLVHHDEHRIVVARGRDDAALDVVRRRRHHDLQTGQVREPRFEALRVLRGEARAGARHREHRDRQRRAAAEHEAHLRHLVGDFVHALAEEVHEHDVDDRPQTRRGRADAETDDAFLGNRRVDDAVAAELLEQTAVVTVDAAGLADVFTGDECGVLFEQYLAHAFGDRADVRQLARAGARLLRCACPMAAPQDPVA